MPNEDSDLEQNEDVELISLIGDYVNRKKIPIQINGVNIFPQPTNIHNLTWHEYPDEPCSNHCLMPDDTDKSFVKFYLTQVSV